MTRRFTLVLCLSLGALGTPASAANRTPTSIEATCIQPYYFHLSERGSPMKLSMERNGYTTRIHEEQSAGLNPTVTLDDFWHSGAGELGEGNGVFLIATVGDGSTGFAAEVRERTATGLDETLNAYNNYIAGEWDDTLIYTGGVDGQGYHIGIKPLALSVFFYSKETLVYSCMGSSYSYATQWRGARDVVGYDIADPPAVLSELTTFWEHLRGEHGPAFRTVAFATNGWLRRTGPGNTVLAPIVLLVSPIYAYIASTTPGYVDFDTEMDQNSPRDAVNAHSPQFRVRNEHWVSSTRLAFDLIPVLVGVGAIEATSRISGQDRLGAVSRGGRIQLDGDAVAPNGDAYIWENAATATDPSYEASFDFMAAWTEPDGAHIACVTGAEQGSTGIDFYAGAPEACERLVSLSPLGSSTLPHYYEVVAQTDSTVFHVREEDSDPSIDYMTAPFRLGTIPSDITDLRTLNVRAATWPDPMDPSRYEPDPPPPDNPVAADYIFYSPRVDFITATQPIRNYLTAHGKSSYVIWVDDDANPELAKAHAEAVYDMVLQEGRPLPFLYILGEANEGQHPEYNIVGTHYYPDTNETCFWEPCASDVYIVDFDEDWLPDMNWSRIVAHDLPSMENSVATYLAALADPPASQKVLFLVGDTNSEPQPRIVLDEVKGWYQTEGITTSSLYNTEYPFDIVLRHNLTAGIINGGITELAGVGRYSSCLDICRFIYRMAGVDEWNWTMALVPTLQQIVAEFPGCGMGDTDRNIDLRYPSVPTMFLTADPDVSTTAVAWHSENRAGRRTDHLIKAETYFAYRLGGAVTSTHEAHFRTIRQLGVEHPEMIPYLYGSVNYGWETRLPGMLIGVPEEAAPGAPQILMARPNPFNSRVTIRYSVPRTQRVSMGVYDVSGRLVVRLVEGVEDAGVHTAHWDGRDTNQARVASGIYFVRQAMGSSTYAVKIVLAK